MRDNFLGALGRLTIMILWQGPVRCVELVGSRYSTRSDIQICGRGNASCLGSRPIPRGLLRNPRAQRRSSPHSQVNHQLQSEVRLRRIRRMHSSKSRKSRPSANAPNVACLRRSPQVSLAMEVTVTFTRFVSLFCLRCETEAPLHR